MQKRFLFLLLSVLVCGGNCWAGETPSYASFTIKPELSKGANAVVRTEETVFTVLSPKSSTERIKRVVTVLNEDGKQHARLVVRYDKLNTVNFIKGTVYDLLGKKVKTLKTAEIKDYSNTSDFSLYEDNRVKVAELSLPSYPYTVEFEYQVTSANMLFYTGWMPLDGEKLAVENASFQVNLPSNMPPLRYHEQKVPGKVSVKQEAGQQVYLWQVNDVKPVEEEVYGPPFRELVPLVRTAPATFEVQGYAGTLETWQALGEWQNKLNAGRDQISEATKQQVQALVKDLPTPEAKVKAIYQFMQNKTRYVSIQLGIGGWQPFEANMVDSKGYGDCKALSNYTKALLEAAGIKSHYALIYAGDDNRPILKDFPNSQFNHVVVAVPTAKDTMWLECTNQMADAGYTGSSTGDRYSLLITPEGGKLVSTPRFTASDNTQLRTVQVKLSAQGSGVGEAFTQFAGLQHEPRGAVVQHYTPDEQLKWLYKNTQIPTFEIKKYTLEKVKGEPLVKEKLQLELPKLASVSGKRLFITPNLMNRWTGVPSSTENRKQEVIWSMSFHDVDSVEYEIPAGYKAESVPQPVKYTSIFGEYKAQVQMKGNKLTYVRQLTMHKGRHAASKYMELVNFLKQVSRADQQQVVLAAETT
ncbi:DUF3857 domain-containing protein [Rufibacter immobilis]|uniref:DUF3857 domain-containing protein n=1 Tax=Rufibacter immobilis TaxID=1348778 RepID=A0A3M9MZK1_9BACT|nr:DUF3857 domain-containing transglutaminase family protein [Rufibacter immobilis]RNI30323.1 DUF3857 domain-containing protein [Rufibacter immobilis]